MENDTFSNSPRTYDDCIYDVSANYDFSNVANWEECENTYEEEKVDVKVDFDFSELYKLDSHCNVKQEPVFDYELHISASPDYSTFLPSSFLYDVINIERSENTFSDSEDEYRFKYVSQTPE